MERTVRRCVHRWLGLPCRRSSAALYGNNDIMQFSFNIIIEEFRVFQMRERQKPSWGIKAGTHWPNRWTSEAFGETRTRSGTNMFGVISCIGSFRSRLDIVCSNSTCEVWGGWLSDVWAIGFSDWRCASESPWCVGGRDTVCALVFYTLRSVISCFHVLENWHETSCYYVSSGQILLCLFGNASLHV